MMAELAETDRIEQDLARTRARMDSRLDELQDHLSPKQMLNDAFAYFRGGEGADFTQDLVARAKANPLPVALVGVGLAWLMASSHSRSSAPALAAYPDDLDARIRRAEGNVVRDDGEHEDAYRGRIEDARGKVLGIARDASDTAASFTQRVKDALAAATEGARRASHDLAANAGDTFSRIGDAAGERGAALQEGTQTMARSTRDTFSSITANPFALGGIAALVGLVAGSLLPTSDEEEHALGSVATKLRSAGKDLAQDVVDRGGRIATDTIAAVKDSAGGHGLTSEKSIGDVVQGVRSGDLIGEVKQVVQETLQAGKDSAQQHLGAAAGAEKSGNG